MKNMTSVCIDGNYLFYKTFSIFSNYGSKQPGDVLSKEEDRGIFMRKIITDLCYALNQLHITGQVIFCQDSRSWRKDLKIERVDYKGDREKSQEVDWGCFFDLMDEFGKFLEINGYIYSKSKGAEGDDLLWFWNKKLREAGHNVVIFSGDKDSHQLVDYKNGSWTICWNGNSKNNKIFCPPNWKEEYLEKEEEVSIFDVDLSADEEKDKIKKMSQSATLETSDPERIIFEKILTGDKGDAVPSVFAYEKTPGKIFKLTPAKASSIYESFKQSGWGKSELNKIWKDEEFRDWISGYVLRAMSYTDNSENRKIVSKNYDDNAKLVWLSDEVIPQDVLNEMEISFSSSSKEVKGVLTDRKTMIGRSKWDSYQAPSAFDPFKNYR
jgi:5'-3' exonuclease